MMTTREDYCAGWELEAGGVAASAAGAADSVAVVGLLLGAGAEFPAAGGVVVLLLAGNDVDDEPTEPSRSPW